MPAVALPAPLCGGAADTGKDGARGLRDAGAGCWLGKAAAAANLEEKWAFRACSRLQQALEIHGYTKAVR